MRISKLIAVASALALSTSANAADFVFTSSAFNLSFSLPDSPTPDLFVTGLGFEVNVNGTFDGSPVNFSQMTFLNAAYPGIAGGFSYNGFLSGVFQGAQVYSGTDAAPTFVAGVYQLTKFDTGVEGTLVISNVAAVPEAATWAMMIGGLGLVGASMRRRSAKVSFA